MTILDLRVFPEEERARKLDEAAHEHVMQQERVLCSSQGKGYREGGHLVHNFETDTWRCCTCGVRSQREELFQHALTFEHVPHYSTSMDAAWKIVERMTRMPQTQQESREALYTRFMLWWEKANLWACSAQEVAHEITVYALHLKGIDVLDDVI